MKNPYLEGGRICTSHGVKGLVKVEHFCDSPRVLCSVKNIYFKEKNGSFTKRNVKKASVTGQFLIMEIEGIASREEAIAYRGRSFFLDREELPLSEGSMFIADMIDLPVYHWQTGESLGRLSDVSDVAGRRIYTVSYKGNPVLIPDVPEFIKEIDEEKGVAVMPIPGLFDEADEV